MTTTTQLDVSSGILTYTERVATVHGIEMQARTINIAVSPSEFQAWIDRENFSFALVSMSEDGKRIRHGLVKYEENYGTNVAGAHNRNHRYWTSYKRTNKKLVRRYLGRPTPTLKVLRDVALWLDGAHVDRARWIVE